MAGAALLTAHGSAGGGPAGGGGADGGGATGDVDTVAVDTVAVGSGVFATVESPELQPVNVSRAAAAVTASAG